MTVAYLGVCKSKELYDLRYKVVDNRATKDTVLSHKQYIRI